MKKHFQSQCRVQNLIPREVHNLTGGKWSERLAKRMLDDRGEVYACWTTPKIKIAANMVVECAGAWLNPAEKNAQETATR